MKTIHERIHGVMKDVRYIQKGDKKVNNQYRYVSHDRVSALLHEAFVNHGINSLTSVKSFVTNGNRTEVLLTVKFVNVEDPRDFVECEMLGYGIDPGDKGPGKAISYAYKYALLKTFMLETGDDPDHDQNVTHEPPEKIERRERYEEYLNGLRLVVIKNDMNVSKIEEFLRQKAESENCAKAVVLEKAVEDTEEFLNMYSGYLESLNSEE